MTTLVLILQIIIALGIFNVWLLRFNKKTSWRGGSATSMKEEFHAYGLPSWFMVIVGIVKVSLAILLMLGIWFPLLTQPAALAMAVLMLGAVSMHLKVKDPVKKALPALTMLVLSLLVVLL